MRSTSPDKQAARRATALPQSWLLLGTTYAVIICGALLLALTERSLAFALLAAVVCAGHALIVGPTGPAYLAGPLGSLLAAAALLYGLLEPRFSDAHISYGLAHFLMLVQLVKLYGRREPRDLHLIQVGTMFEVMVAGIWALDFSYLPLFALTATSLMANFAVMTMAPARATGKAGGTVGLPVQAACAPETGEPGPWRSLWSALWLPTAAVFGTTVLVFMFLPRFRELGLAYPMLPEQVIGFSENVSLHEVGRMRKSDDVALRVQFLAGGASDATPVQPRRRLLRGVSLPAYGNGQWLGYNAAMRQAIRRRLPEDADAGPDFASRDIYLLDGVQCAKELVRQKVTVESKPMTTLFGLYRPVAVQGTPRDANIWRLSHDITFPGTLDPGESYEVLSLVPHLTAEQLRAAGTPRPGGRWPLFWEVPTEIRPALEAAAAEVGRLYRAETDYDRVMAAQDYLASSGKFTYTYDLPDFGEQEPIEAFLVTTHQGSCEQFSTALALILRVWGMPTRLIVGFKAGQYDLTAQAYTFRDRDAHAWVEVYFNGLGWVEFDPTPSADLVEEPAGGIEGAFTGLLSRARRAVAMAYRNVRARWASNIIGYNRSQQRRLLQGLTSAARALAEQASSVFGGLWPGVPYFGLAQVILLVVSFTVVGLGIYVGGTWLLRKIPLRRPGAGAERTLRFYQELLSILRRKGLSRPPHVTPREFAQVAGARLSEGSGGGPGVLAALHLVTDAYYRVRFGGYELTEPEQRQVRQALAIVARAKGPSRKAGPAPGRAPG